MTIRWFFLPLLLVLVVAPAPAQDQEPIFEEVARVEHPHIDEMSGIAKSHTYPNTYWVHNDSGDDARLFAIDSLGTPLLPRWLESRYAVGRVEKGGPKKLWPGLSLLLAANLDWEDIAIDGDTIYVADTGNNGNARRDLGVYMLREPNPRATERMRVLAHFPVRYPDQKVYPAKQWDYDCESLFVSDGKLYFVTKQRPVDQMRVPKPGTRLYRMDTRHTDKENVLTLVEGRKDLLWPLAADLSPDGGKLAVLCVNMLWVFDRPAKGDRWLSGKARRTLVPRTVIRDQAEGITWDDDATLRIACESRKIFRVRLSRLTAVK